MLRKILGGIYPLLAPRTDPYAVHDEATMEGYYTHVHSPAITGDPHALVIIFCRVKTATDPSKRVLVYVLYAPAHVLPNQIGGDISYKARGFAREMYAPDWNVTQASSPKGTGRVAEYTIEVCDIGKMEIRRDMQRWTVNLPAGDGLPTMKLVLETTNRTPWSATSEIAGPEGPFERLSSLLPLHWHVFSTSSEAHWRLERSSPTQSPNRRDTTYIISSGVGVAHIEKNHGISFPTGWIWAHSVTPSRRALSAATYPIRFSVAGGRIVGLEAYLVGFRDDEKGIAWDFTPPWSIGPFGRGPGFRTTRNWERRTVTLDVWDWAHWLQVEMVAPEGTFIGISGPLAKGFTPELCQESFRARFTLTLRERRLNLRSPLAFFSVDEWRWRDIGRYEIDEAALEFGGEYANSLASNMKQHGE